MIETEGAGKGDTPRPVDGDKFREGWDRIFGNKKTEHTHRWGRGMNPEVEVCIDCGKER